MTTTTTTLRCLTTTQIAALIWLGIYWLVVNPLDFVKVSFFQKNAIIEQHAHYYAILVCVMGNFTGQIISTSYLDKPVNLALEGVYDDSDMLAINATVTMLSLPSYGLQSCRWVDMETR